MGNIGCKCFKNNESNDIVTKKEDTMYSTKSHMAVGTTEFNSSQNDIYENKLVRAKAQNNITPGGNEEFDHKTPKSEEELETPPLLNENYMDYAMDLFDEINKYRCDSDLFIDLKKRNPSNLINIITNLI